MIKTKRSLKKSVKIIMILVVCLALILTFTDDVSYGFVATISDKSNNYIISEKANSFNLDLEKNNYLDTSALDYSIKEDNLEIIDNKQNGKIIEIEENELEMILNNAFLISLKTGYEVVDAIVEEILNTYTNSNMTTYQKVESLYEYVIDNVTYKTPVIAPAKISKLINLGYSENDAYELIFAEYGFLNNLGTCNVYSAMFMILTRRIGLDSYTVEVKTKNNVKHTTVNIKINDKWYNFDPQADQNIYASGYDKFSRFGQDEEAMNKTYKKIYRDKSVSNFKLFAQKIDTLEEES